MEKGNKRAQEGRRSRIPAPAGMGQVWVYPQPSATGRCGRGSGTWGKSKPRKRMSRTAARSPAHLWLLPSTRHWLSGQELPSPGQVPAWTTTLCPAGDGGFHILFSAAFLLNINCDYYKTAHPCHAMPEAVQTQNKKKLSALKSLQWQSPSSQVKGGCVQIQAS